MQLRKGLAVTVLGFALVFSGCAARVNHVSNLPPGVSEAEVKEWYQATGAFNNMATYEHDAFVALTSLHDSGVWTDDASYTAALQALGRVDVLIIQGSGFLKTVPNNWNVSVQAQIQTFITEITQQLQTVSAQVTIGVKNAKSQSTLSQALVSITESAALVASLITLAKPA